MDQIWFWQRIVTPHMTELVRALARLGCDLTYVAEEPMSADRAEQGWVVPDLSGVRLEFATDRGSISTLVAAAPETSIHVCQGLRANGLVRHAQAGIRRRGLRHWAVMETVDDAGWRGVVKRMIYRGLFRNWRSHLQGILAIGADTPGWVAAQGMPRSQVFPFAYFLQDINASGELDRGDSKRFRFIFVGSLIERKRLDLLLNALHRVPSADFELAVVGTGPLETSLKATAAKLLPGRVHWLGRLLSDGVQAVIANADCLVLPSRHDGWGAVVSEALMVGTPVLCSDTCGSAGVVRASRTGGVFRSGDLNALVDALTRVLCQGIPCASDRMALAEWAKCLGANQGAAYLLSILRTAEVGERPIPPWNVVA